MQYSIQKILEICNGVWAQKHEPDVQVNHVIFDTRKVVKASSGIFFALAGQNNDGHQYIQDAYNKGVRNFCVSKTPPNYLQNANYIKVDNVLKALQQFAGFHRARFKYPVIAITGSNGKTIIKEWLAQMLSLDFNIVKSPKSYNSQLGVAFSLLRMTDKNDLAIIEAGISRKGEMEALEQMIQPDIVIVSHIGSAHDEGFNHRNEKIQEKLKLGKNAEKIVFHHSDQNLKKQLEQEFDESKLSACPVNILDGFQIKSQNKIFVDNLKLCVHIAQTLGFERKDIQSKINRIEPLKMRLELEKGNHNCILVNDAYSADLDALEIGLSFLNEHRANRESVVILSSFEQTGMEKNELIKEIYIRLEDFGIHHLYWVDGNNNGHHLAHDSIQITVFSDTKELSKFLAEKPPKDKAILFKGARKYALEKQFNQLSAQAHQTVLEIDLSALEHNLSVFSNLLNPETKIMAVIKAGAYGSGANEIAKLLASKNISYLAVAKTGEGIALRNAGINVPIVVLNPENISIPHLFEYQLEPEIYSIEQLNSILDYSQSMDINIHINIDTGMNRLGLSKDQISEFLAVLKLHPNVKVKSVFSHLACSEDLNQASFSRKQIDDFDRVSEKLTTHLTYPVDRHILNSAGIVHFPEAQFDMVRLGLGLYGIDSTQKIQDRLIKVHALKSRIVQIKEINAGESIGYSRNTIARKKMTIATVPIGYADGLLRTSGNEAHAFVINECAVSIIGNVSMDLCSIDISNVPNAQVGDEVIIFNKGYPIELLAKANHTIPYEILSRISDRVKRIFIQD